MALYTPLTRQEISRLLGFFPGLPQTPWRSRGIALGTVNTYYRIAFRSGAACYLKIDEVGDPQRLKAEIRIFEHLHRHRARLKCETPLPLPAANGERFVPFRDKFALLVPEISGRSHFKNELTPVRLTVVGRTLAAWHALPADKKIPEHRFALKGQRRVFAEIRGRLARRHPELARFIARKLAEFGRTAPRRERRVLIHADLFPENILWIGGRLNGIVDFDAAGLGSPLFDLGVCLHALCHDGNRFVIPKISGLFRGYFGSARPPQRLKTKLAYALEISAMRFLLTRLRDFELAPPGRRAEPFKDYRDFEKRFDEIRELLLTPLLWEL